MNKLALLVMCFLSLNLYASFGGIDGAGGNAVVCYDDQESITSVRMLDLYEGEVLEGLDFGVTYSDMAEAYSAIESNMNRSGMSFTLAHTESLFHMLAPGVRLESIDDSGHIFIPANCKIEQIANYYNDRTIYVVSDFYNMMSVEDQAALVLHEYLYWMDRIFGSENSRKARKVTAQAMATNGIEFIDPLEGVIVPGVPNQTYLSCDTPKNVLMGQKIINKDLERVTSFALIPEGNGVWRVQFIVLNGHFVYTKTEGVFYLSQDDQAEIEFPLEVIRRKPIGDLYGLGFNVDLQGELYDDSIYFNVEIDELDLDYFPAPTPAWADWMDHFRTEELFMSSRGMHPGEEMNNIQLFCGEVTYLPEE